MKDGYPMGAGQQKLNLPLRLFVRVGNQVFVAGHGAVDENGRFVSDTFEGQFRYTMERIGETLQAAGADFRQVVMVRGYVRDPANLPLYNALYREYFSEPYPARTTLTGCLPPGLEFEIDCIAVVEEGV